MKSKAAANLLWSAASLALAALAACTLHTENKIETTSKIDAHIVLEIRQIQDQAAKDEDYVRKDAPTTGTKTGDKPASYLQTELALRRLANGGGASWFFASANAQPQQIASTVTSDDKKKALEGRKARLAKIDDALDKGMIGENDMGFVEVRIPKDAPDKDLFAAITKLSADENADRLTNYHAVAQDKKLEAGGEKAVGQVYAGEIRIHLKKGQLFQAPRDPKMFEDFQKSALGKAHSDAKPGDWLKKAIDPEKKG